MPTSHIGAELEGFMAKRHWPPCQQAWVDTTPLDIQNSLPTVGVLPSKSSYVNFLARVIAGLLRFNPSNSSFMLSATQLCQPQAKQYYRHPIRVDTTKQGTSMFSSTVPFHHHHHSIFQWCLARPAIPRFESCSWTPSQQSLWHTAHPCQPQLSCPRV